jgi:hypothetical protein
MAAAFDDGNRIGLECLSILARHHGIDVKPGMIVTAGTRLATLDPTLSSADVDQLRTRKAAVIRGLDESAREP